MNVRLAGIYGILPADLEQDDLLARAEAALKGGVRILQYRDKGQGYKRGAQRARAMRALTRRYGALFIVNDSLQLALDSEADGVHLGRADMPHLTRLRADIGDGMIVGVSCQGDAAFALHALEHGADYVSFGAIFPTASKSDAVVIGLPRLAKARQMFPGRNIVAIGGITREHLIQVRQAGADAAAVIADLFEPATGIEERARRMVHAWEQAA
ncbi:MAG TPA: thiamine phosphate synthase [Mariprofundaceae bacterium]|nr:thiamine phosphate synthase [Mariprofundaceae bacterium]